MKGNKSTSGGGFASCKELGGENSISSRKQLDLTVHVHMIVASDPTILCIMPRTPGMIAKNLDSLRLRSITEYEASHMQLIYKAYRSILCISIQKQTSYMHNTPGMIERNLVLLELRSIDGLCITAYSALYALCTIHCCLALLSSKIVRVVESPVLKGPIEAGAIIRGHWDLLLQPTHQIRVTGEIAAIEKSIVFPGLNHFPGVQVVPATRTQERSGAKDLAEVAQSHVQQTPALQDPMLLFKPAGLVKALVTISEDQHWRYETCRLDEADIRQRRKAAF